MFSAPAPFCVWAAARGSRIARPGSAWLAAVGLLLLSSALFSVQFVGWLIPAAAIALAEGDRRSAWLTAAAVVLTAAFFHLCYGLVTDGVRLAVLLVVARNALVAVLVAGAIGVIRTSRLAQITPRTGV
jgi:hypothetical protein